MLSTLVLFIIINQIFEIKIKFVKRNTIRNVELPTFQWLIGTQMYSYVAGIFLLAESAGFHFNLLSFIN